MKQQKLLQEIYQKLLDQFGPQSWWPAETPFEVIVGAILTQNTNWGNVEKALANLKKHRILDPRGLLDVPVSRLAKLIRPAGYFNIKARRLKNFIQVLFEDYNGSLAAMRREPLKALRERLLRINGIGPETADSILLYAFGKPVFVVDAYTRRMLYRHGLVPQRIDYHGIQDLFNANLITDGPVFNEYHALLVRLGKEFCRTHPRCELCPLKRTSYDLQRRCRVCYRFISRAERGSLPPGELCRNCGKAPRDAFPDGSRKSKS